MNNPFDIESELFTKEKTIEIWVETTGRKKNTFLIGWDIPIEDLKGHIKTIKKKNGCNGTLKLCGDDILIQFQGDLINYLEIYIKDYIDYNYKVKIKRI
jgi:translation initiation factor 1 (eIF-1/SUI1)